MLGKQLETNFKRADEYPPKHKALLIRGLCPFSHSVRGKPEQKFCERNERNEGMWNQGNVSVLYYNMVSWNLAFVFSDSSGLVLGVFDCWFWEVS